MPGIAINMPHPHQAQGKLVPPGARSSPSPKLQNCRLPGISWGDLPAAALWRLIDLYPGTGDR
jgi:hypothetical protein